MLTCSDCDYFFAKGSRVKTCNAKVPLWVKDDEYKRRVSKFTEAAFCDTFRPEDGFTCKRFEVRRNDKFGDCPLGRPGRICDECRHWSGKSASSGEKEDSGDNTTTG